MTDEAIVTETALIVFLTSLGQTLREICRTEHALEADLPTVKKRLRYLVEGALRSPQSPDVTQKDLDAVMGQLLVLESLLDQDHDPLVPLPSQPPKPGLN